LAARAQRLRAVLEADLVRSLDVICKLKFDLVLRDRRGQQDAAARRRAGEFADRYVGRTGQRGRLLDGRTAAIGEHKAAVATILRDTVREGESQHHAGPEFSASGRRRSNLRRPTAGEIARARGALRAVAAELV